MSGIDNPPEPPPPGVSLPGWDVDHLSAEQDFPAALPRPDPFPLRPILFRHDERVGSIDGRRTPMKRIPQWVAWFLRMILVAAIPRILLHGSVYLSGSDDGRPLWQAGSVWAVCSVLLAGLWSLLSLLSVRSPSVSLSLVLCMTIQCTGATVMMAGYIKGGAAALPIVATLLATSTVVWLIFRRSGTPTNFHAPAILGIGVVGLFGLLFIGRFFGRLSTGAALTMLLAPLLCWVMETSPLRHRKPWLVGTLRLLLVAIPLVAVLVLAKIDFDRDMSPLLSVFN